jgi:Flp pilus assembly protein TadG
MGAVMATRSRTTRSRERGQILVLFALGAGAMIAMVGLVLDGGDTYVQRRAEQNGADMAALAGANAYMNYPGTIGGKQTAALDAVVAAGTRNGYTQGVASTSLAVTITLLSAGAQVQVDITRPHQNGFARIAGFSSWPVTVTATAVAGTIDTGGASAPWIMNIGAFNADGSPKYTKNNQFSFGEANGDYPISGQDLAWTDFNGSNNVSTSEVSAIIAGTNVVTSTLDYNQYIGQHNEGNHTALYPDVDKYLSGKTMPVPIVGPCAAEAAHPDGCFKGWSLFHVVSAGQGDDKTITGYFLADFISEPLVVGQCTTQQQQAGTCGLIQASPFGAYVVRLTN